MYVYVALYIGEAWPPLRPGCVLLSLACDSVRRKVLAFLRHQRWRGFLQTITAAGKLWTTSPDTGCGSSVHRDSPGCVKFSFLPFPAPQGVTV